jgi:2-polyprenyl-3-methyl-5-hydroxy-6-metoxy-1,4-benzoquinol methylase
MLQILMDKFLDVDQSIMRKDNFYSNLLESKKKFVNYVEKGHGWKEVNSCPICKSSEYIEEFSFQSVPIVKCQECHLRYTTLVPNDLSDVYESESLYASLLKTDNAADAYREYKKNRFARERVDIISEVCGPLENLSILDVGAGTGFFLEAAAEAKAKCTGLELSKEVCEFVESKYGVSMINSSLTELDEGEKFDVITMFDLIEHVYEPLELMKKAKKHLNENGIIFIYTPNFDSFNIKVLKENSNLVMPGIHLTYFNSESIKKLSLEIGMDCLYYQTAGMDVADVLSMYKCTGREVEARSMKDNLNVLQAMIDESGCACSIRAIFR